MRRVTRLAVALPAILAAIVLADVIATGVATVLELRRYVPTALPLVPWQVLIPAGPILLAVWAAVRGRPWTAALSGTAALAIAVLFRIVQAASAAG